jgi:hypothetical protein
MANEIADQFVIAVSMADAHREHAWLQFRMKEKTSTEIVSAFVDRLKDGGDIVGAERIRRANTDVEIAERLVAAAIAWDSKHPYTVAMGEFPARRNATLLALPFCRAVSILGTSADRLQLCWDSLYAAARAKNAASFLGIHLVIRSNFATEMFSHHATNSFLFMFVEAIKQEGPESATAAFIAFCLQDTTVCQQPCTAQYPRLEDNKEVRAAALKAISAVVSVPATPKTVGNLRAMLGMFPFPSFTRQLFLTLIEDAESNVPQLSRIAEAMEVLVNMPAVTTNFRGELMWIVGYLMEGLKKIVPLLPRARRDALSHTLALAVLREPIHKNQTPNALSYLDMAITHGLFDLGSAVVHKLGKHFDTKSFAAMVDKKIAQPELGVPFSDEDLETLVQWASVVCPLETFRRHPSDTSHRRVFLDVDVCRVDIPPVPLVLARLAAAIADPAFQPFTDEDQRLVADVRSAHKTVNVHLWLMNVIVESICTDAPVIAVAKTLVCAHYLRNLPLRAGPAPTQYPDFVRAIKRASETPATGVWLVHMLSLFCTDQLGTPWENGMADTVAKIIATAPELSDTQVVTMSLACQQPVIYNIVLAFGGDWFKAYLGKTYVTERVNQRLINLVDNNPHLFLDCDKRTVWFNAILVGLTHFAATLFTHFPGEEAGMIGQAIKHIKNSLPIEDADVPYTGDRLRDIAGWIVSARGETPDLKQSQIVALAGARARGIKFEFLRAVISAVRDRVGPMELAPAMKRTKM